MCVYVSLLIVLVCSLISNSCLPTKTLHNPTFESKTLNRGNVPRHGKDTNETIDEMERFIDNTSNPHSVKKKHTTLSSQELLKFNNKQENIANKKNSQDRVKMQVSLNNSSDYDYEKMLDEYYMESNQEVGTIEIYQPVKSDLNDTNILYLISSLFSLNTASINCTTKDDIGLRGIICLIEDIKSNKQPIELVERFWKITMTWLLVYLVVALPLWCTKGWCCCCLTCKFFKPQQTIEEARRFLLLNPPGVYQKTSRREIHYNPSEREKLCYEEFEHLIKTL